jgi:hypothetical protein
MISGRPRAFQGVGGASNVREAFRPTQDISMPRTSLGLFLSFHREQKRQHKPELPTCRAVRTRYIVKTLDLGVHWLVTYSKLNTPPKPPPIGTVHSWPGTGSQFEVMIVDVVKYQPCAML